MKADPVLRLRQICLLARDLEWTSSVLSTAFDAPVVFRDPRMAAGGSLTNTHIRLGDSFLETVSPSDLAWKRSSTQTRLLDRNGDCGYMAIVQVPDVAAASRSMAIQGAGLGIVAGDWNVCPGSPGSGLINLMVCPPDSLSVVGCAGSIEHPAPRPFIHLLQTSCGSPCRGAISTAAKPVVTPPWGRASTPFCHVFPAGKYAPLFRGNSPWPGQFS